MTTPDERARLQTRAARIQEAVKDPAAPVPCQTENCVNGPEPHEFDYDVERPLEAQPNRCQPVEWAGRVRPVDPYNTHFCKIPDCINKQVVPDAHRTMNVVPHGQRDDCRSLSGIRPLRNDPVITNEDGGSQSVIPTVFGTLPLNAIRMLAQLQKLGDDKYGPHNWRSIKEHEHINHAFEHMLLHCTGDRTDDHLLHAAWRLVAAVEVRATKSTYYGEEKTDDFD